MQTNKHVLVGVQSYRTLNYGVYSWVHCVWRLHLFSCGVRDIYGAANKIVGLGVPRLALQAKEKT